MTHYAFPPGGLPEQDEDPVGTAIFTTAFAVLPACTHRDIVTSLLPDWTETRVWILARPLSGFAETFAQYAVEVAPNGGSTRPEPNPDAQAVLFVASGTMTLMLDGQTHTLTAGGYAYIPPHSAWTVHNPADEPLQFHWVRKKYQSVPGLSRPDAFITSDLERTPTPMPNTDKWATTRFADPDDIRHDMHVNIVTFQPGGRIPFAETHIMEHGLYVLEGEADYLLNDQWVRVGPGDFMWLRAFCPQACIARGHTPFRYLLYKDVNRHPDLTL